MVPAGVFSNEMLVKQYLLIRSLTHIWTQVDNFISYAVGQLALEHIKFSTCLQPCALYIQHLIKRVRVKADMLNQNHHLAFIHYNVQSLLPKLDIMQVELYAFYVIALTETWLHPGTDTDEIIFSLIQSSRTQR